MKLLKNALIFDEPLTNTFLENDIKKVKGLALPMFKFDVKSNDNYKINVKVIHSKSKSKVMCIEAKEDFVDFIFGFLTIPLGSILKLMGGHSCVGSIDNLYSSMKSLDKTWCTNSHSVLMDPGLAPQFVCAKQPLQLLKMEISSIGNNNEGAPFDNGRDAEGFVKKPALYVVGDDLRVSPLKSTSMLSFVKEFSLPFDDIEVSVLSIGAA